MRSFPLGLFLVLICCTTLALAAPKFPALAGRVVDNAHILSPSTIQSLEQALAAYENGTSNQVVVATIPSLNGDSIENYGYQLGRFWHIGQKGKDNGALLIVAPRERKVRIEVGYGLEPLLTDAASSQIINEIILPDFRAGRMEQGVVEGTEAMLSVLGGKSLPVAQQADQQFSGLGLFLLFLFFLFALRHPYIAAYLLMSGPPSRFGSSRMNGSGWGGGGFSGGGGSFGGGGASGSW
jgi:uncharacterized protein